MMRFRSWNQLITVGLFALIAGVGCNPATDVSRTPSPQEMQEAKQKQVSAVEERTDLTPEQRAGLKNYYGGGSGQSQGGPPAKTGGN